jgi:predicted lipoprotein with Yx(FWY)xxD motif
LPLRRLVVFGVRILGRDGVKVRSLTIWCAGGVAVLLLVLSSVGVFSSKPAPKETVVSSITSTRYGRVLVVGGSATGGLYHFPLYEFSGDVHGRFGCATTKTVAYDLGAKESVPLTCTGPERDLLADVSSDDWPALTTSETPVAGPGVNAKLLGTVFRRGIGRQITYAGHPLYLFDPSSQPFAPQGENFMETVKPLPPWHGYWYLVSASNGGPSPGVASITSETLPGGRHVLAVEEDGNVDPIKATLYVGQPIGGPSKCDANCTHEWTPLLTSGPPRVGPGVNTAEIAMKPLSDGNYQVTYNHQPLYLYDREAIRLSANDRLVATGSQGNGSDERGPGGVMLAIELTK